MRLSESLRKGSQPALGLPLSGVLAPERLVHVDCLEVDPYHSVARDHELADLLPVAPMHGLRERDHKVVGEPVERPCRCEGPSQNIESRKGLNARAGCGELDWGVDT